MMTHSRILHGVDPPRTMEAWKACPSRKLDALVEILQYHLRADNLPFLMVADDKIVPSPEPAPPAPPIDKLSNPNHVDKIIVYSAFPGNLWMIEAVRDQRCTVDGI